MGAHERSRFCVMPGGCFNLHFGVNRKVPSGTMNVNGAGLVVQTILSWSNHAKPCIASAYFWTVDLNATPRAKFPIGGTRFPSQCTPCAGGYAGAEQENASRSTGIEERRF